jgi:hypothetical protein
MWIAVGDRRPVAKVLIAVAALASASATHIVIGCRRGNTHIIILSLCSSQLDLNTS